MNGRKGFTLIELIVMVVLVAVLSTLLVVQMRHTRAPAGRASCMNNARQIGLAMIQYAGDNDDRFPPLVDASGNMVPAVDNEGVVSSLPARSAFAVLLKQGYLFTTKVFICRNSPDVMTPDTFPTDFKNAPLKDLVLKETECSYGWDPTKGHSADATCAIIADKPRKTPGAEGTYENNTENHSGEGQNVFYNDGHVKWATPTPKPDAGDDPDVYTGSTAPGSEYWKSTWDAKIIR